MPSNVNVEGHILFARSVPLFPQSPLGGVGEFFWMGLRYRVYEAKGRWTGQLDMRHRLRTTGEVTVMTLFMNDVLLAAYDGVRFAIAYFSESYS